MLVSKHNMKVVHRFLWATAAGAVCFFILLLAGSFLLHNSSTPSAQVHPLAATNRVDLSYSVAGEVRMPAQYPYRGEITVMRAIQAAGGFTDLARTRKVLLTRADGKRFVVDCTKILKDPATDLPVYPGDYILVLRREVFSL